MKRQVVRKACDVMFSKALHIWKYLKLESQGWSEFLALLQIHVSGISLRYWTHWNAGNVYGHTSYLTRPPTKVSACIQFFCHLHRLIWNKVVNIILLKHFMTKNSSYILYLLMSWRRNKGRWMATSVSFYINKSWPWRFASSMLPSRPHTRCVYLYLTVTLSVARGNF
jgi:hypothetical protein